MIKVFQPDDTDFTSAGDVVVQALKAVVHKEEDSEFYLDLEAGAKYSAWLDGGNIVIATTPQGEQAFRIRDTQKTRYKVNLRAKHIYFDAEDYFIPHCDVSNPNFDPTDPGSALVDCNMALTQINEATDRTSPFTVGSDITRSSMEKDPYTVENKSLLEAIKEIQDKFGGAHVVRDNWDIQIPDPLTYGQDRGVTIRYGKNLEGITRTENWDNVVTKLLPIGKDGAMLTDLNPSETTPYISSATFLRHEPPEVVPTAPVIIVKSVQFEQDIEQGEEETEEHYKGRLYDDLLAQGEDYFREHCVPTLCYEIKAEVVQISDVGDTVEVADEELGIDVRTHVIAYDYDVIQGRYTSMTFASHNEKKLSHLITNITAAATSSATKIAKKMVDEVQEHVDEVQEQVDDVQDQIEALNSQIITAELTSQITNLTTGAYTAIVLDAAVTVGDKLTLQNDGSVLIGADVHKVKVSAVCCFSTIGAAGNRHILIGKNGSTSAKTLGWCNQGCSAEQAANLIIPPVVADVTAGDKIYLYYQTSDSSDAIYGNYGNRTSLTVEVVG